MPAAGSLSTRAQPRIPAFSKDAGRTFGAPVRLDDEASLGRVDVELLPDGSAAASWIEVENDRAQFRLRLIDPSGKRSAPISIAGIENGRTSGYPRLAFANGELLFAWTARQGTLRVKTAAAPLPPAFAQPAVSTR